MLTFKEFIKEGHKINISMTQRDIEKHIKGLGWTLERNKGDHDVYGHVEATHKLAVPRHKGNLAPGTVRQIVKASMTFDKQAA